MADKPAETPQHDWSGITGAPVVNLREPKIPDVPADIVALAEASYIGRPLDGQVNEDGSPVIGHVLEWDFGKGQEAMAAAFADHMKNAGHHTKLNGKRYPMSVGVAVDPENDGSKHVVRWRAGEKKGRKATPPAKPATSE